ncbi:queuosine precursor transporter [Haloplanus halobius]|uniref:queuosine precursor transporter n=1 Tax=Haloplanus halobius TaxID=2934938 RepID=UPI00200FCA6A|nr:queuosine precursor transporter [Haloplanus sp. XH21]
MSAGTGNASVSRVAILALFITALVTAQLTAAKVLAIPLPQALPRIGSTVFLPGAALAYALTFFASDCYAELYGRRDAQVMVNVGFVMNFILLALVWTTIVAPGRDPEFGAQFAGVLAPATNIVAGSLLAYLVSQNWDVLVFHRLREATDGDSLWLRNILSTATSQAIDTVIFVGLAFYLLPQYVGIGSVTPWNVVVALMLGQYLLKLLIALVDTPFVYLVVGLVRSRADSEAKAAAAETVDEA